MNMDEKRQYFEFTRFWATIAFVTTDPQNITSCINLHIEFFWRRTQMHFCIIKSVIKPQLIHQSLIKIRNIFVK